MMRQSMAKAQSNSGLNFKVTGMLTAFLITILVNNVFAVDVNWSGSYRSEWVEVESTSLANPKLRKSYLLNHFNLNPKIIAGDGIYIMGKFEVLPNSQYPNSQMGQVWGPGVRSGGASSTNAMDSNVMNTTQGSTQLRVSQLYLNINQEYGSLLLGRAPLHFGTGMSHNAGNSAFDHWNDIQDLVGYKFVVGNTYLMPIISKVYDENPQQGSDITDQIFIVQYEHPESGSSIGMFNQNRSGKSGINDAPIDALNGDHIGGGFSYRNINVYFAKTFENFDFKLEGGFLKGSSGVFNASGEDISLNSYGVAFELNTLKAPKYNWSIKAGVASGDDPNTRDFEGYGFNKNYDLAFLMFNHRLGQMDFLKTKVWGSSTNTATALDDETISNALYLSPTVSVAVTDKIELKHTVTMARLLQSVNLTNVNSKEFGFEYDLTAIYSPQDRVQWINQLGLLMPGSAFAGGDLGLPHNFTYGIVSKAAISF